jgi:hypothetical protein
VIALLTIAVAAGVSETTAHLKRFTTVAGITLEKSSFDDAARTLGPAPIREDGDGAAYERWSCYVGADGTVLLVSGGEMHVGQIIDGIRLATRAQWMEITAPKPKCVLLARLSAALPIGRLELGMRRAAVDRLLRGAIVERKPDAIRATSEEPAGDDFATSRALEVRFKRGRVVSISVSQTTSN